MNDQQQHKALEDLKVIRAMMEAANKAVAHDGIFFVLFGVYWLVATALFCFPGFEDWFKSAPHVSLPLWIGFIIACTILLARCARRSAKQSMGSGLVLRVRKRIGETIVLGLAVIFLCSFVLRHVNLDLETRRFLVPFMTSLVLGFTFYFSGVISTPEFRIVGLLVFAGMVVMCYARGHELVILGFSLGLGMILAGIFTRRRWLRLKREEKSGPDAVDV